MLEGERTESRDPALGWVTERVREGGGLVGATPLRLPLRRIEWAALALVAAFLAGAGWPHRWRMAALLLVALAASVTAPIETGLARHLDRAVVRGPSTLDGAGVTLEPGQVVRILRRDRSRLRVAAGPGISGWLAANAVYALEDLR